MEVSALKYSGGIGLHGRSPLLRLQSDERLITLLRRGNTAAFEVLVSRYESRLLAFCRHLLGSREDAEDVLQEVLTAAFNAILSDERPINVRPWLYRIARNRSLNHLRRIQAIGVDSMDHHLSEHGASTADKVHEREEFRLLVGDIQELPETQKTALVLREMDALSYEQIAEAMETTVPSVKSLLVRARVSLAEAAEARLLTCEEVRIELAEVAEGLQRRPGPLVRRHLRDCKRCAVFKDQLKHTNKALAALLPVGPLVFLKKLAFVHLTHSAGSGATAAGSGAGAATAGAGAAGAGAVAGAGGFASTSGLLSAGAGAVAGKAAAGLAAAALVTAGAVEVDHGAHVRKATHPAPVPAVVASAPAATRTVAASQGQGQQVATIRPTHHALAHAQRKADAKTTPTTTTPTTPTTAMATTPATTTTTTTTPGRTQTQQDPTVLSPTTTAPAPPLPAPPAAPVIPPPATPPTTTT
ncbi:MAG TPA: sigma-70 family RNA polymerase sigma factor, partial [Solirubrobacteraceae bacterium]|nr:sigma-70 family RNA polymerase sigma factor [Solirubrobacteraceae bacterium]